VQDERIPSVTGIEADEATNRLLVAVTDLEKKGWLGIYDLTTGDNLAFVDFVPLLPNDPEHFINDIAVDTAGNAYVTDSLAGVIYRVDPAGNATIFLEDERF
jgi:sugar lactone lactonase YvrE